MVLWCIPRCIVQLPILAGKSGKQTQGAENSSSAPSFLAVGPTPKHGHAWEQGIQPTATEILEDTHTHKVEQKSTKMTKISP